MYPDWKNANLQNVGDYVWYNSQVYKCILQHVSNVGNAPPNATYWQLIPYGTRSQFGVLADSFFVQSPTGDKKVPFIVQGGTVAIDGDLLVSGSIKTPHLAAGLITADKVAANAIEAGKIAANAVTANTIAAGAITAGKLAADSVSTNNLQANSIVAGKIAANAITAGHITADSISTNKIQIGAVTTSILDTYSATEYYYAYMEGYHAANITVHQSGPGLANAIAFCYLTQSYQAVFDIFINDVRVCSENPIGGTLICRPWTFLMSPNTNYKVACGSQDTRNANGTAVIVIVLKR
jgi:hypothetical protein